MSWASRSSAIVTKILIDLSRIARAETRLILGVIVVEDIFLALYLAALQPIISGAQGITEAVLQAGKAFGFLLVLAAAARYGTCLIGRLITVRDNELLVISFLGAAVLIAGVSEVLGVADAIGAFLVGLILAGTPSGPRIRELVHPLRDAFAAIFFFAFGLAIDPGDIASVATPVAAAAALTIVINVAAGLLVARLYHHGPQPAARIATTLLARGEFALILAAMATSAGLDGPLAPFIVRLCPRPRRPRPRRRRARPPARPCPSSGGRLSVRPPSPHPVCRHPVGRAGTGRVRHPLRQRRGTATPTEVPTEAQR